MPPKSFKKQQQKKGYSWLSFKQLLPWSYNVIFSFEVSPIIWLKYKELYLKWVTCKEQILKSNKVSLEIKSWFGRVRLGNMTEKGAQMNMTKSE